MAVVALQGREGEITSAIAHRRRQLNPVPASIQPEDAFSAGPELAAMLAMRVTDASSRDARASSVKGVLIGAVPDRGGRIHEMSLSARDLMPEWKSRSATAAPAGGAAAAAGALGGGGKAGRGDAPVGADH
ncbi:DUF2465 domain-containing protein, partial [archaeon]